MTVAGRAFGTVGLDFFFTWRREPLGTGPARWWSAQAAGTASSKLRSLPGRRVDACETAGEHSRKFCTRCRRLAKCAICFSKTTTMHDVVIGLFVNRYAFGVAI